MSYPLTDGVPLFGSRFTKTILTATSLAPGGALGENQLTYMEDTWLSQSHVGTHLDGMGHIGRKDCYFNQTPMGKFITQNNMTKLGLEHLKPFATRGVIVDMVKVFQQAGKFKGNSACKKPCLEKGTLITAADIQAGLKMYNVTLREGRHRHHPHRVGRSLRAVPGPERALQLGRAGHRQGSGDVADLAEGRRGRHRQLGGRGHPRARNPKEAFIVHKMLLTDNGIHIIENVRTDLMAAEAAATGRATFFFSMTVPKGGRHDRQLRRDRRHPLAPDRFAVS